MPPPLPRRRPQFSLLSLFALTTVICLVLTWWYWPRPVTVTALIQVNLTSQVPLFGEEELTFSAVQWEASRLFQSDDVLQAAIRDPAVAKLPLVLAQGKPIEWLREELVCDFPQQGEIMTISLQVAPRHGGNAAKLLDMCVDAFLTLVAAKEKQFRQQQLATLRREYDALRDEIKLASLEIAKIKQQRGDDDPEVKIRQLEANQLVNRAADLTSKMNLLKLGPSEPSRVRRVQPAIVTSKRSG